MQRKLIFGLIAATILSACGIRNLQGNEGTPFHTAGGGQGAAQMFGHGAVRFNALNLTADQKTKIQAIMKAQRQAMPKAGRESMQALRTALLAPTVDGAQLASLLRDTQAKRQAQMDHRMAIMSQVRDVLTPEQRTKAAASLPGFGRPDRAGGHDRMARLFDGLTLTADQQAAVNQLKGEFAKRAVERKDKRAQMAAAMSAFAKDGDQAALKTVLGTMQAAPPIDALVRVATSLDQTQRMAIAKRMGAMRHGMGGHHRRSGGHGHRGGATHPESV